ncbi:dihydrofolate reductase family protein [Steroidobacter agaridevorans]|uniref:dihydrofolate reductase family protein n=1 Tax=Steroidobacter agaridevorans TaxID=2695856 RepID=UPI0013208DCF|nr:dihydrofolate reductase family protein [Steroidobacter agaridevorans]GFE86575.1 dihydrofolate reductase [Steroidobacter agaridevorans]
MRKLISINHVSLDGVMQSPGASQEDPRGGFELGGWIAPYMNEALGKGLVDAVSGRFDLLLGRRTYEMLAAYWPHAGDNPITNAFNRAIKYVATRGTHEFDWVNTQVLPGDAVEAARRLKSETGPDIQVYGSSSFLQSLIAADLIDEYVIRTYPIVLGSGKRLFEAGAPPRALKLVETQASSTGVIVSRYQPEGAVKSASSEQEPSDAEKARRRRLAAEDARQRT